VNECKPPPVMLLPESAEGTPRAEKHRAHHQGLYTLVPISAQLELTLPLCAQLQLTVPPS